MNKLLLKYPNWAAGVNFSKEKYTIKKIIFLASWNGGTYKMPTITIKAGTQTIDLSGSLVINDLSVRFPVYQFISNLDIEADGRIVLVSSGNDFTIIEGCLFVDII